MKSSASANIVAPLLDWVKYAGVDVPSVGDKVEVPFAKEIYVGDVTATSGSTSFELHFGSDGTDMTTIVGQHAYRIVRAKGKRSRDDPQPTAPRRPVATATAEKFALNAAEILRVAFLDRVRFRDIIQQVLGMTDKQSVPAARILLCNKAFHAMLWKHGARREAVTLNVLCDAFDAFDKGHLEPLYRDYVIDRARFMLYRIVGTNIDDAKQLNGAYGKTYCGIEANVIFRLLASFDAREARIKRSGTYDVDRTYGTDDIENCFGELVGIVGYMAKAPVVLAAFKKSERRAESKMDPKILQYMSQRKRYPPHMITTRADWSDGQRLPDWWPRSEVAYPTTVTVPARRGTTHTSSAKAAKEQSLTTRAHAINKKVGASKVYC